MRLPLCILAWLAGINLVGFLLCGVDKHRARRGRWRVSEAALLLTGLAGGSFGLLFGMKVYRHKTKHLKFRILVPLECVLWGIVLVYALSALTLDRRMQVLEIPGVSHRIDFITDARAR